MFYTHYADKMFLLTNTFIQQNGRMSPRPTCHCQFYGYCSSELEDQLNGATCKSRRVPIYGWAVAMPARPGAAVIHFSPKSPPVRRRPVARRPAGSWCLSSRGLSLSARARDRSNDWVLTPSNEESERTRDRERAGEARWPGAEARRTGNLRRDRHMTKIRVQEPA